jgi:hypothetical protein
MPPKALVHPLLRLQQNGFCCRLCPTTQPYICLSEHTIVKHLKDKHQWARRSGRRSAAIQPQLDLSTVVTFPITY